MTGAICWLSAARLACMFSVIGSAVAAAPLAALLAVLLVNGAEGSGVAAAVVAGGCAALLAAGSFAGVLLAGGASSAPQPFNAIAASASNAALAMHVVFLMSASGSVEAVAVSNPFKKQL
jgi:hypothetical protein